MGKNMGNQAFWYISGWECKLFNLYRGHFGCTYITTMRYTFWSAILLLVIYPPNIFHKCEIIYVTKVFIATLLVIARD